MPVNKNALLRYQILDRCLRNRGRRWTWKDLQNEVNKVLIENDTESKGIGKTTLFEDLKDLEYRIYNADIEKIQVGRTQYLRYSDSSFSINNQPLNDIEANQLKAAIQVLSRFNGNPQFDWIHEMIPMLESKLGLIPMDHAIMTFDHNLDYEGLIYIMPIFNAIINKRVLNITYQDFRSPLPYVVEVDPYHLRQYNNRWYIFGLNRSRERIENFALDRIKEIAESIESYNESNEDWEEYFSDIIGVSKLPEKVVEIRLFIADAVQADYIRTNPIHMSQKKIRQVIGGFETSIKVIPNFEFEKIILSFGEKVKIVSPDYLKEKVLGRLKESIALYSKETS